MSNYLETMPRRSIKQIDPSVLHYYRGAILDQMNETLEAEQTSDRTERGDLLVMAQNNLGIFTGLITESQPLGQLMAETGLEIELSRPFLSFLSSTGAIYLNSRGLSYNLGAGYASSKGFVPLVAEISDEWLIENDSDDQQVVKRVAGLNQVAAARKIVTLFKR